MTVIRPVSHAYSEDENLFKAIERVLSIREKSVGEYLIQLKRLCNHVRKSMDLDRVLGMINAIQKEDGKEVVLIFIYDIEATENNFYTQKFDENKEPYLEYENEGKPS